MKKEALAESERSFSFTLRGKRKIRETLAQPGRTTRDEGFLIYQSLRDDLRTVPFGDYLKRYIYLNSGMSGSFQDVPVKAYRQTLMDAFRENGVPASMDSEEIRLATVTGRWLEQFRVSRETVLLLGFGLNMLADEVNLFLTEALHDHRMDSENPLEGICEYCFQRRYGWHKFIRLRKMYEQGPEALGKASTEPAATGLQEGRTIRQDRELLACLFQAPEETAQRRKTWESFRGLYQDACRKIVLESSGALKGEPTSADVERVFCPPVFRDRHGNLKMTIRPEVRRELSSRRFTRQHLHLTLSGQREPDRYDLLTLGFYLHTDARNSADAARNTALFEEDMNQILTGCGYGPIYPADPYECFLLMALSTPEPMESYNNVMELALEGEVAEL